MKNVDMSTGRVEIEFKLSKDLYYKILSELTGTQINNEHELIDMIKSLSDKKNELGSFGDAISEVNLNGFGVVTPDVYKRQVICILTFGSYKLCHLIKLHNIHVCYHS